MAKYNNYTNHMKGIEVNREDNILKQSLTKIRYKDISVSEDFSRT